MRPTYRTQIKLLILLGVLITLFVSGLLILDRADRRRALLLVEDKRQEKVSLLSELINLGSEPPRTFAYDYSFWDDMVTFSQTGDSAWAAENIDVGLQTFQTSAAWVYRVDGSRVYAVATPDHQAVVQDNELEATFRRLFAEKPFHDFFRWTGDQISDFHIAPLQPSNDDARATPAQGYFVTVRIWDDTYLAELGEASRAELQAIRPDAAPPTPDSVDPSDGSQKIWFSVPLLGPHEQIAGSLVGRTSSPILAQWQEASRQQQLLLWCFSGLVMIVLLFGLYRWVSYPLNQVSESLQTGNPAVLRQLRNNRTEFGQIAELINSFFIQKQRLEYEVIERRHVEKALRESEDRFAQVAEQSRELVWEVDASGLYTYVSRVCLTILGYREEEIVGLLHFYDLHPEEGREEFRRKALEVFDQRLRFTDLHNPVVTKDGRVLNVLTNGVPIIGPDNSLIGYRGSDQDITERRRAEQALRDREDLLRATLESTADGILVIENAGQATHWNRRFQSMWGIPQEVVETRDDNKMLEFVLSQLCEPEQFLSKVKALYASSDESFDVLNFVDGRVFERYSCPLIRDGAIVGRVWSFRDMTQKKKAEEARQQLQESLDKAQRMESLGALAGGVAHDLNNLLGPVVAYPDMILEKMPPDNPLHRKIERIGTSAKQAAAVIQDLLTLARRGRYEMVPTDINEVISSYLDSLSFAEHAKANPRVTIRLKLDPAIGAITGSSSHLLKVIMNLIVNAFDAMPSGGDLVISTRRSHLERLLSGHGAIIPGDYVVVSVKDTGTGIKKEDIQKIFEPYYSRKKMGKSGTGLGLAIVYGVVKDHRGYYDVISELEVGTEFLLYFPVTASTATTAAANIHDNTGHETILVVDDVESQRELACDLLSMLGYQVAAISSGREAVEHLRQRSADLVVLDMIIEPNFDGLDTYRAILKERPGQRAILASGYSNSDRIQQALRLGAHELVLKPYTKETLGRATRAALDSPRPVEVVVPN